MTSQEGCTELDKATATTTTTTTTTRTTSTSTNEGPRLPPPVGRKRLVKSASIDYSSGESELSFRPRGPSTTSIGSSGGSFSKSALVTSLQAKRASMGLESLSEDLPEDKRTSGRGSAGKSEPQDKRRQQRSPVKEKMKGDSLSLTHDNGAKCFPTNTSPSATIQDLADCLEVRPMQDGNRHGIEELVMLPMPARLSVLPNFHETDDKDDLYFLQKCTRSTSICFRFSSVEESLDSMGETKHISPPFRTITSNGGYLLAIQCSFRGDQLSLSVILKTSDNLDSLQWPFKMFVIFRLVQQTEVIGTKDRVKAFRCDKNTSKFKECLSQPKKGDNPSLGFRQFISKPMLKIGGFIKNGAIKIQCVLLPKDITYPSELKFELPCVIR